MVYTVDQAKEEIKNGIRAYLMKGKDGRYLCDVVHRIPFYMEGQPGIGKTDIVRQAAEELGIGFASFSITHHTRNSLLGLPVISELECGKYTEYTMSELIATPLSLAEQGRKEGILLLDEFNCASESIMPAMLAFLQTRNIGKYRLPDGWCIVLCGNPPEYNRNAKQFDAVILDRVRKINVEYSVKDFLVYAKTKKLHPQIIRYLGWYKENLYRCERQKDDTQMVTCRGWENLSYALSAYETLGQAITPEFIHQYLKSGEIAYSFYDYYMITAGALEMKSVYEILQGKNTEKHLACIREKDADLQMKLVDVFVHVLAECVNEDEKYSVVSRRLSHAFRFLAQLDDAKFLTGLLFESVNSSAQLLEVMLKVKNEEYLSLCKREYVIFKNAETAWLKFLDEL